MSASTIAMAISPQFSRVLEQMNVIEAKVYNGIKKTTGLVNTAPSIEVTCFDDDAYNKNMLKKLEEPNWTEVGETSTTQSEVPATDHLAAKQNSDEERVCSDYSKGEEDVFNTNAASPGDERAAVQSSRQGSRKNQPTRKGFPNSSQETNRTITPTKVENNNAETKKGNVNKESAGDKLKTGVPKTARRPSLNSSSDSQHSEVISSPSVRRRRYTVSSFSGENDTCIKPQNNSTQNNRKTSAPGSSTQNSCSTGDTVTIRKKPERIDLLFKVDSMNSTQSSHSRGRSQTYGGLAHTVKDNYNCDGHLETDEVFRTCDDNVGFHDGNLSTIVGTSPNSSREAFQSKNSENGLFLLKDAGVTPNTGNRNVSKSASPTRRISTSVFEGANRTSSGRRESSRSIRRSQSDLSSEADGDITQRLNLSSPPQARKIIPPKPPPGEKPNQLSVRVNRSRTKSETDLRKLVSDEENEEETRRVSVFTPPRARKLGEAKSLLGDTKAGTSLGVSGGSLSKSATDLRKLVSDEEDEEERKRRTSVSTPPRMRKFNSSLGVCGNPSLRKSETDLRKLVPEEEDAVSQKQSLATQSPRMRRISASLPQSASGIGVGSCPLSPREERKIYLAAAKSAPRLPARTKSRNDLQASSQFIIDQAEKELDKLSERLPHISMEQVMKSWQTDRRHWNMVSTVVNPNGEGNASKTNMAEVKDCRYIRESVVTKKKKNSH